MNVNSDPASIAPASGSNWSSLARLCWKEFRVVRGFAMSLLLFGIAMLFLCFLGEHRQTKEWTIELIVTMMPVLVVAGGVATSFSMEHENNSFLGQRLLPTKPWEMFVSKTLVPIVAGGFVFGGLSLTLAASPWGDMVLIDGMWLIVILELTAWCALFSMLIKRPLLSLTLGVFAAVAVGGLVRLLLVGESIANEVDAVEGGIRVAISLLVLGLDVWLVRDWFDDQLESRISRIVSKLSLDTLRSKPSWGHAHESPYTTVSRNSAATSVLPTLRGKVRRMHWLLFRTRLLFMAILGLGTITLMISTSPGPTWPFAVLASGVIGGMAFSEKRSERITLATLGISPGLYWFTRLLIPMAWVFALWAVAQAFGIQSHEPPGGPLVVFSAFALGQLISCLSTQLLLTMAGSVITSMLVLVLGSAEIVPVWLVAFPLAVMPLAMTRILCNDWLKDLHDRRSLLLKIASISGGLALFLVGLGTYRVQEVPSVSVASLASIPKLAATDPHKRDAFRNMFTTRMLNEEQHERFVDALLADEVDMSAEHMIASDWHSMHVMPASLTQHARKAIESGDAATAEREIRAILKFQKLSTRIPGATTLSEFQIVTNWAQIPGVTDRQIDAMLEALEENAPTDQQLNQMAAAGATFFRRIYRPTSDPLLMDFYNMSPAAQTGVRIMYRIAFWEEWRAQRIGKEIAFRQSELIQRVSGNLKNGGVVFDWGPLSKHDVFIWPVVFQPRMAHTVLDYARSYRLTRIGLELARFQRDKGKPPETLTELGGGLSRSDLIDPFSGEPFVYWPHGLPKEWLADSPGQSLRVDAGKINFAETFVWSPRYRIKRDPTSQADAPHFLIWEHRSERTRRMPVRKLLLPEDMTELLKYQYQPPKADAALQLAPLASEEEVDKPSESTDEAE